MFVHYIHNLHSVVRSQFLVIYFSVIFDGSVCSSRLLCRIVICLIDCFRSLHLLTCLRTLWNVRSHLLFRLLSASSSSLSSHFTPSSLPSRYLRVSWWWRSFSFRDPLPSVNTTSRLHSFLSLPPLLSSALHLNLLLARRPLSLTFQCTEGRIAN